MQQPHNLASLKVQAPGKLILSGEHAVLYGNPALAIAIDRHAETSLFWQEQTNSITFHLLNLGYTASLTLQKLHELKQRVQNKYNQFLNGECTIIDVIRRSFELLQYAVIHILDRFNIQLPNSMKMYTTSQVPVGCGMGSSAATIVSVIHAIDNFLGLDISDAGYLDLGREIESLQHGKSSGLDIYAVLFGGCVKFADGKVCKKPLPKVPMYIVNTGSPEVSTGQTINAARSYFEDQLLLDDFAAVTNAFEQALIKNDKAEIQNCIRANHKLLTTVGIVPKRVQEFIAEVENHGAAAKVCGAGASCGDSAGAVLVVADDEVTHIAQKYGYDMFPIQGDADGAKIISS